MRSKYKIRSKTDIKKIPEVSIEYQPTKFQYELLEAFELEYNHIYLTSQVGNGKSFGLCALIILKCLQYPGIRVGLGRQTIVLLKKTTVVSLFEVLGNWNLLDKIDYNEQKGEIKFENGSTIIFIDLEHYSTDPEYLRLNGLLLTFAVVDEAGQLKNNKGVNILFSRCGRWKNKKYNIGAKIIYALNPTNNYIRDLYVAHKEGKPKKGHYFIEAKIDQNQFLPSDYYDNLRETLSTKDIKRLIEDDWFYDNNPNSIFDVTKLPYLLNNQSAIKGDTYLSCDIAMSADRFVITYWEGLVLKKVYTYNNKDGKEIVNIIKDLSITHNVPQSRIVFDADGVGLYLEGYLTYAKGIRNNSKPLNGENYTNLKSQLYFMAAKMTNEGKVSVEDEEYFDELKKELELVERIDGEKVGVIPKSEMKRILGKSPDLADAFAYRFIFEIQRKPDIYVPKIHNKSSNNWYD